MSRYRVTAGCHCWALLTWMLCYRGFVVSVRLCSFGCRVTRYFALLVFAWPRLEIMWQGQCCQCSACRVWMCKKNTAAAVGAVQLKIVFMHSGSPFIVRSMLFLRNFPGCFVWNGFNAGTTMIISSFEDWLAAALFYTPLLQAFDGVMPVTLCPKVSSISSSSTFQIIWSARQRRRWNAFHERASSTSAFVRLFVYFFLSFLFWLRKITSHK